MCEKIRILLNFCPDQQYKKLLGKGLPLLYKEMDLVHIFEEIHNLKIEVYKGSC